MTGYIELWGRANDDPGNATKQASLNVAVSWIPSSNLPNFQLDFGTNIGLTSATPRIQAYIGVSQRF